MISITQGETGPAVEDIQQRLVALGYNISSDELETDSFGPSTLAAVRSFRSQHGLPMGDTIDNDAWIELVDASYRLGDRTLYLRLPYFHGADVSDLQMTLNILGFTCGEVDGYYGPYTEAAVREFQSNIGLLADGMAFQDTFDAIERLHHVWDGKTANPEFSMPHMGLARTADVLETHSIVVSASDPIARSVANRVWNVACATTNDANVSLVGNLEMAFTSSETESVDLVMIIATAPLDEADQVPDDLLTITVDAAGELEHLSHRFMAALSSCIAPPCHVCVEFAYLNRYDGTVDNRAIQTAAIALLDAVCSALSF